MEENIFCKYCGKKLDDESMFCPKCGRQVTRDPVAKHVIPDSRPPKYKKMKVGSNLADIISMAANPNRVVEESKAPAEQKCIHQPEPVKAIEPVVPEQLEAPATQEKVEDPPEPVDMSHDAEEEKLEIGCEPEPVSEGESIPENVQTEVKIVMEEVPQPEILADISEKPWIPPICKAVENAHKEDLSLIHI